MERGVTIFFLLFSGAYLSLACQLPFGELKGPQNGFLPQLSGFLGVLLSLAVLLKAPRQAADGGQTEEGAEGSPPFNWRKLIFVTAGLLAYIFLLKIAGYLFTAFLVTFYLLKVTDSEGWLYPGALSAGIAALFFVLFKILLGAVMP